MSAWTASGYADDWVSLRVMIERQRPLAPEAALTVLKSSLLALAAAHRAGGGHRDYPADNVLVDAAGKVRVTDSGAVSSSPAAEIYAAMAVFFECLIGKPPFAPVPLDRVDPPLRRLIAAGLAKDPVDRPQNALAFVSQLDVQAANAYGPGWEERGRRELADRAAGGGWPPRGGGKAAAARPPRVTRGGRGGGRRRGAVVIATVAAAAVVAIGGVATAVTLQTRGHQASPADLSAAVRSTPSFQAVADVTPPVAASKCTAPTSFNFTGTISATAPGTVTFQWIYSSGKTGPVQTVSFTSAGHKTVAGARVTVAKAGGGWGEIKLLSPGAQASDEAAYKLICGSRSGGVGTITASATVTPAHRTASCVTGPLSFTITGFIRATKAGKVTYYWAQSHGYDSAPASLTFTAPGVMPARPLTITPPGASGSGSAVLVVTSPVTTASSPAPYTLTCLPPPPSAPSTSPTAPTSPTRPGSHRWPGSPTGTTSPTATQPTAGATTPQGLSATATVSPATQNLSTCGEPADAATFSGTITDDQAGTVSYYWDLPTGHTPEQDLVFTAPGTQSVAMESIGAYDNYVSESGRIVITSPRAVTSNDAAFTVTCPFDVPLTGLEVVNGLTSYGLLGHPFDGMVAVAGGTGPYTWSDLTGLPPGVTVTAYDGLLRASGTPTQAGHFNGSVLITDSSSPALTTTLDFQVFIATQFLTGTSPSSVTCKVGQPCSFSITVVGGDSSAYNWLPMDGDVPDGLSGTADGATFTVSGTPTAPGSYVMSGSFTDGLVEEGFIGWTVPVTVNPLTR